MDESDPGRVGDVRPAPGAADLIASVLLLGVAVVLGLAGAEVIWVVAGQLTASSGPGVPTMCTFEQAVVAAALAASLVLVACATVTVAYRRHHHLLASPAAAMGLGAVIVVCAIASRVAYVGAATVCHM
ncbi:hypothetical protein GCM10027568_34540 [Humibacter soli]